MTDSTDDPDWSLLPDDPMRFFGLSEGFDQKTLKRRYNNLIRRFKPEKFPLRFQQIRTAYESLHRLCSATPFEGMPFRVVQISADEIELSPLESPANADPTKRFQIPPAAALLDRVRAIPPEILHQELRQTSSLTRDERLLLTFLDDADQLSSSTKFLDGLLAAVQIHRDEETWELLRHYLQTPEPRAHCAEMLERIFFVLASDDAFSLTEPWWDELQRRVPFEEFQRIFDDCVRHVTDHRVFQRLTFEIRLLKRTLFYADPKWTAERLARLTRGDVGWPDWLDHQIWNVEQLVSYTRVRSRFLNGNRLREMLDNVVQVFCHDDADFDRLYVQFQSDVVQQPQEVMAAFSPKDRAVLQVVWNVWQHLTEHVAYRFSHQEARDAQESLNALTQRVPALKSSSRPLWQSPFRWRPIAWVIIVALYLGIPFGLFLLMLINGLKHPTDAKLYLLSMLGVVLGCVLHLVVAFIDTPSELRWWVYASRMRQELFAFLRRHPLPPSMLLGWLTSRFTGHLQTDNLLMEAQHDIPLKFYSAAAWALR